MNSAKSGRFDNAASEGDDHPKSDKDEQDEMSERLN